MEKAIAMNASMIDLSDATIFSTLFDSLLDETMRCLSESEDENAGMEQQMEMVAFTCAIIRGDVTAMPLVDATQPMKIAARLKQYFESTPELEEFAKSVKDNGEFIFMALCLMTKDFVQLMLVSSEAEESQEVFDLRRDALVADWVKRFIA